MSRLQPIYPVLFIYPLEGMGRGKLNGAHLKMTYVISECFEVTFRHTQHFKTHLGMTEVFQNVLMQFPEFYSVSLSRSKLEIFASSFRLSKSEITLFRKKHKFRFYPVLFDPRLLSNMKLCFYLDQNVSHFSENQSSLRAKQSQSLFSLLLTAEEKSQFS